MTSKDATKLYNFLHTMYKQLMVYKLGNRSVRYVPKPELIKLIDSDSPDINAVLVVESAANPISFTYFLNNGKVVTDCGDDVPQEVWEKLVNTLHWCIDGICDVHGYLSEVAWYKDNTMAVSTSDGVYTRWVIQNGIAIEER